MVGAHSGGAAHSTEEVAKTAFSKYQRWPVEALIDQTGAIGFSLDTIKATCGEGRPSRQQEKIIDRFCANKCNLVLRTPKDELYVSISDISADDVMDFYERCNKDSV